MEKINNGNVQEAKKAVAKILALGTANPTNCIYQKDYPDFYFRITNSDHLTDLKDKFKRICEKSAINKRFLHLTEEFLKSNPNICTYQAPSLNARQDLLVSEVPKLGKQAAMEAIKEWGQPISKITHVIFCTTSGTDMPGADYQLTKLLGLNLSVNRFMIYQQGCFAGGTALRLAKDLAENNRGARVLLVCSDITGMFFHAPSEAHLDRLIGQSIFGDGAAAAIVGAGGDEAPVFELVSAGQTLVPNTGDAVVGHLREMGFAYSLANNIPKLVGSSIEGVVVESFRKIGMDDIDWNSLFYAVHPGGRAVLDEIQQNLGLKEDKLRATRHVLREYGNMGAPCVLFALDYMRKKSMEEGKETTGDGLELGVLLGIGPGITFETVVLRSCPILAVHSHTRFI